MVADQAAVSGSNNVLCRTFRYPCGVLDLREGAVTCGLTMSCSRCSLRPHLHVVVPAKSSIVQMNRE